MQKTETKIYNSFSEIIHDLSESIKLSYFKSYGYDYDPEFTELWIRRGALEKAMTLFGESRQLNNSTPLQIHHEPEFKINMYKQFIYEQSIKKYIFCIIDSEKGLEIK